MKKLKIISDINNCNTDTYTQIYRIQIKYWYGWKNVYSSEGVNKSRLTFTSYKLAESHLVNMYHYHTIVRDCNIYITKPIIIYC